MSQSTTGQVEVEEAMTEREGKQFAEIIETRKNLENFYTGEWLFRDYPCHSEVIQRNHHEPHENCTGHLLIVRIEEGKSVYRRAIARLIARSPSMLQLLEKALPIIEAEANMRDAIPGAPFSEREGYWVEMRELVKEFQAEIDKAKGKECLNERM